MPKITKTREDPLRVICHVWQVEGQPRVEWQHAGRRHTAKTISEARKWAVANGYPGIRVSPE